MISQNLTLFNSCVTGSVSSNSVTWAIGTWVQPKWTRYTPTWKVTTIRFNWTPDLTGFVPNAFRSHDGESLSEIWKPLRQTSWYIIPLVHISMNFTERVFELCLPCPCFEYSLEASKHIKMSSTYEICFELRQSLNKEVQNLKSILPPASRYSFESFASFCFEQIQQNKDRVIKKGNCKKKQSPNVGSDTSNFCHRKCEHSKKWVLVLPLQKRKIDTVLHIFHLNLFILIAHMAVLLEIVKLYYLT